MNRQSSNYAIVAKLLDYFEKNPQIRFHQGLWNLNIIERDMPVRIAPGQSELGRIIDKYNEESTETLKKLTNVED